MAEKVLTNAKIYYGGHDFSGNMNSVTLTHSNELLDVTCFGSSNRFRKRKAGLTDYEVAGGGYWNATTGSSGYSTAAGPDNVLFNNLGTSQVLTVVPHGTNIGNDAFFAKGAVGEYSPSGSVGEMLAFNFTAYGVDKLVRGKVMESGNMSTTLTETQRAFTAPLGASDSPRRLYMAAHMWKINKDSMKSHILVLGATDSNMLGSGGATMFDITPASFTSGNVPGTFYQTTKLTSSNIHHFKVTIQTSGDAGGTTHNIWAGIIVLGIK